MVATLSMKMRALEIINVYLTSHSRGRYSSVIKHANGPNMPLAVLKLDSQRISIACTSVSHRSERSIIQTILTALRFGKLLDISLSDLCA